MDELQNKLGQILNDPEAMQKIMALAQGLNSSNQDPAQNPPKRTEPQNKDISDALPPGIDLSMIQKLSGFASQNRIDKNEQTLLKALGPYLSRDRISKLERAMRAAKMARMATALLGASGNGR